MIDLAMKLALVGAVGVIGAAALVVLLDARRMADTYLLWLTAGLVVVVEPALIFGTRAATAALALGALWLGIVLMLARPRRRPDPAVAGAVALFLALLSLGMLRGASGGVWRDASTALVWTAILGSVALYGCLLFTTARDAKQWDDRMLAVLAVPGVYVIANILLQQTPITFPTSSLAAGTEATLIGGSFERVQLPISSGVNSMGAIAAVGAICAAGVFWHRRDLWWLSAPLLIACGYAMLISDSRFAIAVAAAGIVTIPLMRRLRAARGLALLLPLSPVLMILLLGWISESGYDKGLSREGGSFATGTGRTEIWAAAWDHGLSDFKLDQVFGYGLNGQIPSGIYPYYSQVFGGSQEVFGVHNVYLQTIIDLGYVGVLSLIAVVIVALGRLFGSGLGQVAALGLGALMLCGVTEALPVAFPDAFVVFLALVTAAVVSRPPERSGGDVVDVQIQAGEHRRRSRHPA